jgi:hypothetical protein
MEIQQDDFIGLIDLLEDNKKFPYYAAERRIDLFLSYYIEHILTDYFNQKNSSQLCCGVAVFVI